MFRKLDSLRGLIALAIVLYHSQFFVIQSGIEIMHNAYLCVDMLFILSGFLLSAAYGDRIRQGLQFRQFIVWRIGRLYPLHATMMLVWLCYVLTKQVLYQHGFGGNNPLKNNDFPSFFGSLLLLNSIGLFDHVSWNVPSWSIGALMLSYIGFYAFCKIEKLNSWFMALSMAILGYGFIGLSLHKTDFDITYDYGFLRCLAGFYAGVFCYEIKQHWEYSQQHWKYSPLSVLRMGLLEILAVAALLFVLEYAERSVLVLYGSLPLLCTIILLLSSRQSGLIGTILESPLLLWLGRHAFSIYLTHYIIVLTAANICQYILHWPMQTVREQYGLSVMGFVGESSIAINMMLVLCVLSVSALTYRYIEEPCRRWSRSISTQGERQTLPVSS